MSPGISLNKIVIPFRKLFNAIPNGSCTLLTATTYSATRINLAWTNGSTNEDGISIERSDDGITFAEVDTVGAGVTVYADTPLTEATQYWYRVRAYRGAVPLYSDYSNTAEDTTFVTALIVAGTVEYGAEDEVDVMFGWNLSGASVPATTAFAIAGKTITGVAVAGGTVTLTVSVAYTPDVTGITVDYTMPAVNRLLRDSDGAEVASWTGAAVTNNIMDDDIATYIEGMATPLSSAQLTKVNAQFIDMKTGLGITDADEAFDIWYYLGNETAESSLRNMVKRSHDAVAVNAPTHTPYEGWQGDGISSYIDSNYNSNTQGVNYVINNGSIGVYSRTDSNGAEADMGCRDGSNNDIILIARYSGNAYGRINSLSTLSAADGANTNAQGLYIVTRNGNLGANNYLYKNKTQIDTGANSSAIPSLNIFLLGRNSTTGLAAPSTRQLSLGFVGEHITTGMRDTIVDTFEALMDSNSKGVIT